MTFVFDPTIPAANNNPSVDQPVMLANNVASDGIIAVDHIGYNLINGGNHLQVHLPQYTAPTIVNGSATEGSVIYSAAGVADTAHAQCFFKNANNINFPMSFIRAWGYASGNIASPTNSIINNQSSNVTSVIRTGLGIFTVTLNANVVTGVDYGVLVSSLIQSTANGTQCGFFNLGAGVFELHFLKLDGSAFTNPTSFAFQVMQI